MFEFPMVLVLMSSVQDLVAYMLLLQEMQSSARELHALVLPV